MTRAALTLACVLIIPIAAHADCQDAAGAASARADSLPSSDGKAALLEQIQRAAIAHHEGDEESCRDELSIATGVLDDVDAAGHAPSPR